MINALREKLQAFGRWVSKTLDASDFFGLAGLGGIFYGLYMWKPFIAYIVVGLIIFVLSVLTGFKAKSRS